MLIRGNPGLQSFSNECETYHQTLARWCLLEELRLAFMTLYDAG